VKQVEGAMQVRAIGSNAPCGRGFQWNSNHGWTRMNTDPGPTYQAKQHSLSVFIRVDPWFKAVCECAARRMDKAR